MKYKEVLAEWKRLFVELCKLKLPKHRINDITDTVGINTDMGDIEWS